MTGERAIGGGLFEDEKNNFAVEKQICNRLNDPSVGVELTQSTQFQYIDIRFSKSKGCLRGDEILHLENSWRHETDILSTWKRLAHLIK